MSPELQNFINPYGTYHGRFSPAKMILNANLQEFANKVQILAGLNSNGKLSCEQVYEQLKSLSSQLLSTYEDLRENEDE